MDPYKALFETLNLLLSIVPVMFTSLLVSNVLFSLPQFRRIFSFVNDLISFSNLKSGFAIASFLVHPIVGISMLSAMYKSGAISFRETAYSVALSILPRGLRATMLFLAPVAISVLGIGIGLYFISLDLISKLIMFVALILLARLSLRERCDSTQNPDNYDFNLVEVLKVFLRTVTILFISAYLTFLLFQFDLGEGVDLTILLSGAMSTTAGISVAGALIHSGVMDWKRAVFLIYLSRIFHVFVESLRLSMPLFTSFFGIRDGLKLLSAYIVSNSLSIALSVLLFLAL